MSGTLDASSNLSSPEPEAGGSSAVVAVYLYGPGNTANNSGQVTQGDRLPPLRIGLLQNFTGNNDVTTDPFTVIANQPFTVTLNLSIGSTSGLGSNFTGIASAGAHFGSTLTFASDGPVFTLPAGYTANSIAGNIIDNHFVPAVPLPSAIWLLATALGALGWKASRPSSIWRYGSL